MPDYIQYKPYIVEQSPRKEAFNTVDRFVGNASTLPCMHSLNQQFDYNIHL